MFSGLSRSTSKPLLLAKKIFVLALASRATCRVTLLNEADTQVEAIYKMNQRNAFADARDQEAREMVYSRTAAGARMLRDLVYRAWLESALPVPSSN
jgi:hypothetical protein